MRDDTRTRSRIRWAGGIILLTGAIILAAVTVAGSRQAACTSCHEPYAAELAASGHAAVGCYDCHLAAGAWSYPAFKLNELASMYPAALLGREVSGPTASTSAAACLQCHTDTYEQTSPVERDGLRIVHKFCAADSATCDGCHSTTAHGASTRNKRGPVMEDCTSCHIEKDAVRECDACHAGKRKNDRLVKSPFQVTHGPDWRKTHGLGELDGCIVCHETDKCQKCHGIPVPHPTSFGGTHGTWAIKVPDSCGTCHRSKTFCTDCHGDTPMPHPKSFLAKHSKVAKSIDDPNCVRCHSVPDCERCHTRHIHPGGAAGIPVPDPFTQPNKTSPNPAGGGSK